MKHLVFYLAAFAVILSLFISFSKLHARHADIKANLEALADSESPRIKITICFEHGSSGNLAVKKECPENTELYVFLPENPMGDLQDVGMCLSDISGGFFTRMGYCYEIISQ